jgi:uncharacterized membrane protein YhaH (DUF805 family)
MTTRSAWWLKAGVYLISIILACFVATAIFDTDYKGGGGAVWFVVVIMALLFRMLIGFILNRARKKDKELKPDGSDVV